MGVLGLITGCPTGSLSSSWRRHAKRSHERSQLITQSEQTPEVDTTPATQIPDYPHHHGPAPTVNQDGYATTDQVSEQALSRPSYAYGQTRGHPP